MLIDGISNITRKIIENKYVSLLCSKDFSNGRLEYIEVLIQILKLLKVKQDNLLNKRYVESVKYGII